MSFVRLPIQGTTTRRKMSEIYRPAFKFSVDPNYVCANRRHNIYPRMFTTQYHFRVSRHVYGYQNSTSIRNTSKRRHCATFSKQLCRSENPTSHFCLCCIVKESTVVNSPHCFKSSYTWSDAGRVNVSISWLIVCYIVITFHDVPHNMYVNSGVDNLHGVQPWYQQTIDSLFASQ